MDFEADSAVFLRWLQEQGGASISDKIALVDLRAIGGGRGVIATKDVEAEEDLFEIPRSTVLSVENSDLRKKLPGALDDLDSWLSLVVVMIYEYLKTPETLWRPYFRVLPGNFDTLIFWSSAELAELQGSAVTQKIGKDEADKMFCEQIVPIIRTNPHLFPYPPGLESYEGLSGQATILAMAHTMATLVMAYGFDIEKDESKQQVDDEGFMSDDDEDDLPKGMVPLADMLNADAEGNNARLFYAENSLVMKSLSPIKKGEQIFNDYGPLPRSDLLRRYGYVTDKYASYDVVELSTELIARVIADCRGMAQAEVDASLRDLADKVDLADAHDLTHPGKSQSCFPDELLVLIKSIIFDAGHSSLNVTGSELQAPRITGDIAHILRKIIVTRQQDYATTLASDQALLQDSSIQGRRRMAIDVRLGEKMILKEALEELEKLNISSTLDNDHSLDIDPTKRRAEQDENRHSKKRRGA